MARILMGWELGANRGHLVRMLRYRRVLVEAGHQVALATQRIDGIVGEAGSAERVWQAPLWPRLLAWAVSVADRPAATMGDILARLGLAEPGVLAALVRGWESILLAERPDIVVAEYAPALLRAAAGRAATIAIGNGFDLPPATMPAYTSLSGLPAVHDERGTVALVNADLASIGRPPIPTLPAIFAASHALPAGLDELDPYAADRPGGMGSPLVDRPLVPLLPPQGDEIFVYWPERGPGSARFWEGLRRTGRPVRVYLARSSAEQRQALAAHGFLVEPQPLPMADIVRRSRLLVSHGGGGFVVDAMLSGRPQAIVHYDLEKRSNGLGVDRAGLGAQLPFGDFDVDGFAHGLVTLYEDGAWMDRALAGAAGLRARMRRTAEEEMVDAVAALA